LYSLEKELEKIVSEMKLVETKIEDIGGYGKE